MLHKKSVVMVIYCSFSQENKTPAILLKLALRWR